MLAINLNNFHGTANGKVSNGNVYNGVATEEEHVKEMNGRLLAYSSFIFSYGEWIYQRKLQLVL